MPKLEKKTKTMDELTSGYEQFIKGKKTKANGKKFFDKVLKKSSKPKVRGSK